MCRNIFPMSSTNSVIISAAGGGKTTRIGRSALACRAERSGLFTYTDNNIGELKKRFYELNSAIPDHVEVWSWYTFLLREMARPYQTALFNGRIAGISWVEGRSETFVDATKIDRYYFHNSRRIYSDKLARFVCECNKASDGAVIKRLEQRFDRLYIDEIQDMAGWDIEVKGRQGQYSDALDNRFQPVCANLMVEIGHFPSWPRIEIRRPCNSSSH